MKKMFLMVLSSIMVMATISADIYEGLSVTPVEGKGLEVLLTRDKNTVVTTLVQMLTLGRMTEESPSYDTERAGFAYVICEMEMERVMEKAAQTLRGFLTSPISEEEFAVAKELLSTYGGLTEEELAVELGQVYNWLSAMRPKVYHGPVINRSKIPELGTGFQFNTAPEDQENVGKLIYALSHYSYWQLLWKQKEVNALGDSVRHVPPLQFLLICVGSEKLKGWMQNIRNSTLKWRSFMSGFGESIAKEKAAGRLNAELPGFVAVLDKKKELTALEQAATSNDWMGFVDILLK